MMQSEISHVSKTIERNLHDYIYALHAEITSHSEA